MIITLAEQAHKRVPVVVGLQETVRAIHALNRSDALHDIQSR